MNLTFTKNCFYQILYLFSLARFMMAADTISSDDFRIANSEFALNAYKYLSKESKGRNIFFSPFSVSAAMSMVYLGARGPTADQMEQALIIQNMKGAVHPEYEKYLTLILAGNANFTLNIANRLYPSSKAKFVQSFFDACSKHYHADVKALDFGQSENARQEINKWVYERTALKIRELIPSGAISSLTVMVLANAIYFKGNWASKFHEGSTQKGSFMNIEGKDKKVDMMFQSAKFPYTYDSSHRCNVLELPYAGKSLSMVVILPDTIPDFGKVESTITSDILDSLLKNLESVKVDVNIPKFKLESTFELPAMFKSMGLLDLFTDKADLSGMDETKMSYVSNIFHKAYVDVNEEGTEAAAATAVVKMKRSIVRRERFTANRPFLFFIRDTRTGIILFAGRVVDFDGPVLKKEEL